MEKKTKEFSKTLLLQESALIWIMTIALIVLAFLCVHLGYLGSLPWITAMAGFPWTAYGVSQACYYNKSKAENTTGGIKYASVIGENFNAVSVDPAYYEQQYNQTNNCNNIGEDIDIWGQI